ncbi:MAG TPA: glycosyltransferase [Polyangiaceae bacterium]|nr:glycosyltransferase [Polyangiaceae bacterium]
MPLPNAVERDAPAPAGLRVLARPAYANRSLNPYNHRISTELARRGVAVYEYRPWSWFARRYDVAHVHWPESTFNHGLAGALATTETLLRVLDALRARGTRVVWTAHNVRSHGGRYPRPEAAFWRRFAERVDGVIALTEGGVAEARRAHPGLAGRPAFVVPHPHYRGEYDDALTREGARRRLGLPAGARVLLFFGQIAEYKNVPSLVREFAGLDDPSARLVVAGRPKTAALAAEIAAAAAGDGRVVVAGAYVAPGRVQEYFRAADAVVLPYRDILNSGSALLALSFDRPVLLPRVGAFGELRAAAGEAWVRGYDELSPGALAGLLDHAASLPERTDGAHLAALSPAAAAAATIAAYEALLGGARGGGA